MIMPLEADSQPPSNDDGPQIPSDREEDDGRDEDNEEGDGGGGGDEDEDDDEDDGDEERDEEDDGNDDEGEGNGGDDGDERDEEDDGEANRAPELIGSIEPDPQEIAAGQSYRFDAGKFFDDPDGDELSFAAISLPPGIAIDPASGVIAGTAGDDAAGRTFSVTVSASDGRLSVSDAFALNVVASNRAPLLDRPIEPDPQEAVAGDPYSFDAGAFFSDPDGDELSFTANGLPSGLVLEPATGLISGTPQDQDAGAHAVRVSVSDGGASTAGQFTLHVLTENNDAPMLPDPPPRLTTPEDTPLELTPALLEADDEEPDALTVVLTPPSGDADFRLSGSATVVPNADFNGTVTVEAHVRDAETSSNSVRVAIEVTPVNDAPRIGDIPRQIANEGRAFALALAEHVSDVENDPLSFEAEGLPPGLQLDAASGLVSGTPPRGTDAGDYPVRFTVHDGLDSARGELTIAVMEADRTDIAVSADVSPNPVLIGELAAFTLAVRNDGGIDVASIELEATFSAGMPHQIHDTADASCAVQPEPTETILRCTWGPLAAGQSRLLDVHALAEQPGEIAVTAAVSITAPAAIDDTPQNDEASAALIVTERASAAAQQLPAPGARAMTTGDFDGDGIADIAVATAAGEPTLIFLNGPDSSNENKLAFTHSPIIAGSTHAAADIAAADLDGDGDVDVVIANEDGEHRLLINESGARFAETALEPLRGPSRGVAVADLDGDGLPELVFAGEVNAVMWNHGAMQFSAPAQVAAGASLSLVAADLFGDPLPELVFAHVGADTSLHTASRDGGFLAAGTLPTGAATSVATADFDDDGDLDLAVARAGEPTDLVFLNTAAAGASFDLAGTLASTSTRKLLTGDFDADGLADVMLIATFGVHQLYSNAGGGAFLLDERRFTTAAASDAVTGRFNPDDRLDIAVATRDSITVFFNDAHGNFGQGDETAPALTLRGESTITIEVGDAYQDAGATASDETDGDLTDAILVDNPVNTDVIGTYTVTYTVTDSAGNAAPPLTRTVEVSAREASGGGGGAAGAIVVSALLLASAVLARRACGSERGTGHGSRATPGPRRPPGPAFIRFEVEGTSSGARSEASGARR